MLHIYRRLRAAVLVLILPWTVRWSTDGLELLQEEVLDAPGALDPWQVGHLLEAYASACRMWDALEYVAGRGQRIEDVEPVRPPGRALPVSSSIPSAPSDAPTDTPAGEP